MADGKEIPLSIILRTVDKYSAELKQANERIERAFKPYRTFSKELGKLSENLGLPKLRSALASVGGELKNLAVGAGIAAAAVAAAGVHMFKSWVDELDGLRDVAKRVGVSIDTLAQLRFAGSLEGVEGLDAALEKMSRGIGEAKAGTGEIYSFLGKVSPVLRKQVLAAKSNEEAFFLFADAMAKIEDPAKKAALATQVFGRGGAPLINMLEQGSGAIREQMREYFALAGSQEAAANQADGINDAMAKVKAGLQRVKATIVTALGPAIESIAERMRAWLGDPANQERIRAWITDFGEKLPGRIQVLVAAIKEIAAAVKPVWHAIGGAKGALLAFVAIKTAPLVTALLGVVAALGKVVMGLRAAGGAAAAANAAAGAGAGGAPVVPVGPALLAAGVGASFLTEEGRRSHKILGGLKVGSLEHVIGVTAGMARGGVGAAEHAETLERLRATARARGIDPGELALGQAALGMGAPLTLGMGPAFAGVAMQEAKAKITVDFKNAPKGTRVEGDSADTADVDLNVGYQMGGL